MTLDVNLAVAAGGLLVMLGALIALVVLSDRRHRDVLYEMRRVHLQQATIIAMLLRAGFRGPREGIDWGDSGSFTQVRHGNGTDGSVRQ